MKADNIVQKKAFLFAVRIVKLYQYLMGKKEYVIANQILRSGTSIGANLEEAQGSYSRREFQSKINIVYKEARETRFWLLLLRESQILSINETESIFQDCEELLKITGSIIKSLKNNQQ
ncbi:MAG: four helix bundle protein [Bacteroidales bacterium]|nr:four helix bundle protein [Bacteroidales bacterium]